VRTQPTANIRAAAALLSAHADELGVSRSDMGAWAPAAARLSGISNAEAQAQFIHNEVYAAMREGVVAQTPMGDVAASLLPSKVQARFPEPSAPGVQAMSADYAPAIWRASPNYNARPAGYDISMIVIHTCEGGYSGCWSWLANSQSGASAHYVVNESGSEITQLVAETNRAWHVAASYDCGLNGSIMCGLNGQSVNNFSVGIEHGGYASQSSFPAGQIDASAKLSCDISRDRTVVRDSYHIVSHGRLQPATRTDPGPNWPWSTYITKIKEACGEGNIPTVGLVVDSNNANNDSTKASFTHSANWIAGANAGYYGNNYLYANAEAVSDPAVFSFFMSAAGTRTIDAWWVAGSNRSASAPFVIINSNGVNLGTVNANQQLNGGKWNTLGTFNFTAGWNKVQLSRWTTAGTVVVADAIQVR
ncbi:MAG TPA: N-acetylmuramoyl-L-alanine amidase, partial [Archangium sp.]|nr:N-acetylmuramoyl-L-alanine amidase [Archangium sp.]